MSRLLINEPPLQVLPSLAVKIGLQEAVVLQQVHYWLQAAKPLDGGGRWVFNTYEQWAEQFPFWSPEAIRKIFKSLRDKGLIVSRPRGLHAFDRVNEYTIDYDALASLHPEESTGTSGTSRPDHPEKFTASERKNLPTTRTENTAETTSEITTKRAQRERSAPIPAPEDIDPQVWTDWLRLRAAKKAPVTGTVIQGARAEAAKAGMTITEFLTEWCNRGSQGLKAEWIRPAQVGSRQPARQSRHTGFDQINYREGINDDGSF